MKPWAKYTILFIAMSLSRAAGWTDSFVPPSAYTRLLAALITGVAWALCVLVLTKRDQ